MHLERNLSMSKPTLSPIFSTEQGKSTTKLRAALRNREAKRIAKLSSGERLSAEFAPIADEWIREVVEVAANRIADELRSERHTANVRVIDSPTMTGGGTLRSGVVIEFGADAGSDAANLRVTAHANVQGTVKSVKFTSYSERLTRQVRDVVEEDLTTTDVTDVYVLLTDLIVPLFTELE
jgi:hypothetical protein